jgi:hypothetical protein
MDEKRNGVDMASSLVDMCLKKVDVICFFAVSLVKNQFLLVLYSFAN